ncbi:DUF3558 family protein [Actinokineospora enzanensis]|uniref:DUF3558 family protein n=1 Tax=Actinokineospora enzanensis TaxID=155975 RepID=UPI00039ED4D4|nr:DUF3558 family protein [Actinokineospora enzanensis]
MRTKLGLTIAVAAAGCLAACSSTTGGTATTPRSVPDTTTTGPTRTSSSTAGGPLAKLDPCDMLTDAGKSQLGVSGAGQPDDLGSGRSCLWKVRGPEYTTSFRITLYDHAGIDDLPSDLNNKALPDIGGHKAVQTIGDGTKACSVSLAVTASTRAAVLIVAGADQTKACELAENTAAALAPQLPH